MHEGTQTWSGLRIDPFLQCLFRLADDDDQVRWNNLCNIIPSPKYIKNYTTKSITFQEVQKQVCRSLTLLLESTNNSHTIHNSRHQLINSH
jgi:hypothetical protein